MEIRRTVLVPHSAETIFDLIEAAEHYPQFLPWCAEATIVHRDDSVVVADIVVAYHGVRFAFTTRNPKRRPTAMSITLERGPFRHFAGDWRLTPLGDAGCRIDFVFRHEFSGGIMRAAAGPVFERITTTLVDAFVARADSLPRQPVPDAVQGSGPAADTVPAGAPMPASAAAPPPTDPAAAPTDSAAHTLPWSPTP